MHVIAKSALVRFWEALPPAQQGPAKTALTEWYRIACAAEWNSFADVKASFNSADWVGDGKVVFDVGGNKYRVVCLIGFRTMRVFVVFVGTHSDYDRVDVRRL